MAFPMIIETSAVVRLDLDGIVVHDVAYIDGADQVDAAGVDALFERLAGLPQQPTGAALADDDGLHGTVDQLAKRLALFGVGDDPVGASVDGDRDAVVVVDGVAAELADLAPWNDNLASMRENRDGS